MSYRRSATPRRCFRILALSPARVTRVFIHYAMSDEPPSDADTRGFADGQGIGSDVPHGSAHSSMAADPCFNCNKKPSVGSKKYCGWHCGVVYCSDACQQADWPHHKKFCKEMKEHRKEYKSVLKADNPITSSREEHLKWFFGRPGRHVTCQLLAWKHRALTPVIVCSDGEPPHMMPRYVWDKERTTNSWGVVELKQCCEGAAREDFEDTQFLLSGIRPHGNQMAIIMRGSFDKEIIAIGDIVNALTSRMSAEEEVGLSPMGFIQSVMASYLSYMATCEDCLKVVLHDDDRKDLQQKYLHAFEAFPFDEIPSRENKRWLAYILMGLCHMDLNVTIVGLKSATHLNGREAVIHACKQTSAKFESKRIVVTLATNTFPPDDDIQDVCIKPANFDLSDKPTSFDYIAQIAAEAKATGKPVTANLSMMTTTSDTFIAEYNEAVVRLLANASELISLPSDAKSLMAAIQSNLRLMAAM